MSAITCRASWQIQVEDIDLAKRLISSKRLHIDDSLSTTDGVHFFISSITGTLSNSKRKGEAPDVDTVCNNFYPGVAYFMAFSPSQLCNEQIIMKPLHDHDTEAEIKTIQTWAVKCDEKPEDIYQSIMEKGVFQVIKDHSNGAVQKMVQESNQFCAAKHIAEIVKDMTKKEVEDKFGYAADKSIPEDPKFHLLCRLVIVNENEFGEKLREIAVEMRNDGLCLFVDVIENPVKVSIRDSPPSDFFKTVDEINRAMMTFSNPHVLYKGMVYCKTKDANFTFVEMMDPESYLNKLLANEVLREQVMRHMDALLRVILNPQREVFPQIKIDQFNFIEVSGGCCFKISERKFVPCPFTSEDLSYHHECLWHMIHQHHQSQNILRREYSIHFLT